MQKIAIVIPCYNEALRLKPAKFLDYLKKNGRVSFIFVNDGSDDNTQEIIDNMCNSNLSRVFALSLKNNCGKAEAVRQGVCYAIRSGFPVIGFWDADLATPLSAIEELYDALIQNNVKLVMGSRVKLLGRNIFRRSFRHYTGRIFATCASIMLKIQIYDTQCGAKLFLNDYYLTTAFSSHFITDYIFDVEIIARYKLSLLNGEKASFEKYAIEFPLMQWTDVSGSKLKIKDYFQAITDLFQLFLILRIQRFRKPYLNNVIASISETHRDKKL